MMYDGMMDDEVRLYYHPSLISPRYRIFVSYVMPVPLILLVILLKVRIEEEESLLPPPTKEYPSFFTSIVLLASLIFYCIVGISYLKMAG